MLSIRSICVYATEISTIAYQHKMDKRVVKQKRQKKKRRHGWIAKMRMKSNLITIEDELGNFLGFSKWKWNVKNEEEGFLSNEQCVKESKSVLGGKRS